jgi:tRNA nucleotidyltransferase/poly(A) polymerase
MIEQRTKIFFEVPKEISKITKKLQDENFEAFLVGGCVRDLFLNREPND